MSAFSEEAPDETPDEPSLGATLLKIPTPRTNRVIEIKLARRFFQPIIDGIHAATVQFNHCEFKVGDELNLREFSHETELYSGRSIRAEVTQVATRRDEPWLTITHVLLRFKTLKMIQ